MANAAAMAMQSLMLCAFLQAVFQPANGQNTADACAKSQSSETGGLYYACYEKGFNAVPIDFHCDSTWLAVSGNPDITTLAPGTFDKYTTLRRIYLHDNNIESLPVGLFDKQKNLQRLYLYGNNIRRVPKGFFDKILYLPQMRWSRYGYGNILKCSEDQLKTFSCNQCYDSSDNVQRSDAQKKYTTFSSTDDAWECLHPNCPVNRGPNTWCSKSDGCISGSGCGQCSGTCYNYCCKECKHGYSLDGNICKPISEQRLHTIKRDCVTSTVTTTATSIAAIKTTTRATTTTTARLHFKNDAAFSAESSTWVVPDGVASITVHAWGSAGCGGGAGVITKNSGSAAPTTAEECAGGGVGGRGGYIKVTDVAVTAGDELSIQIALPNAGLKVTSKGCSEGFLAPNLEPTASTTVSVSGKIIAMATSGAQALPWAPKCTFGLRGAQHSCGKAQGRHVAEAGLDGEPAMPTNNLQNSVQTAAGGVYVAGLPTDSFYGNISGTYTGHNNVGAPQCTPSSTRSPSRGMVVIEWEQLAPSDGFLLIQASTVFQVPSWLKSATVHAIGPSGCSGSGEVRSGNGNDISTAYVCPGATGGRGGYQSKHVEFSDDVGSTTTLEVDIGDQTATQATVTRDGSSLNLVVADVGQGGGASKMWVRYPNMWGFSGCNGKSTSPNKDNPSSTAAQVGKDGSGFNEKPSSIAGFSLAGFGTPSGASFPVDAKYQCQGRGVGVVILEWNLDTDVRNAFKLPLTTTSQQTIGTPVFSSTTTTVTAATTFAQTSTTTNSTTTSSRTTTMTTTAGIATAQTKPPTTSNDTFEGHSADAIDNIVDADQSEAMIESDEKKRSRSVAAAIVGTLLLIALAVGFVLYHRHQPKSSAIPILHHNVAYGQQHGNVLQRVAENDAFALPENHEGDSEPYLIVGMIPAQDGGGGGGDSDATTTDGNAVCDGGHRSRSASVVAKAASNNLTYSIPFDNNGAVANEYLVPQATNEADDNYDLLDAAGNGENDEYDMPDAAAKDALPTNASGVTYSVPNIAGSGEDDEYDMPNAAAKDALPTNASGVTYSTYTSDNGVLYSVPTEITIGTPANYSDPSNNAQMYTEGGSGGGGAVQGADAEYEMPRGFHSSA